MAQPFRLFSLLIRYFVFASALLFLVGCDYSRLIAWSPDGRYVAFPNMGEEQLWVWDTSEQRGWMLTNESYVRVEFINIDGHLAVHDEDNRLLLIDFEGRSAVVDTDVEDGDGSAAFSVSPDGRFFYYLKHSELDSRSAIWRTELLNLESFSRGWNPEFEREMVLDSGGNIKSFDLHPTENLIVFADERATSDSISTLDLETRETTDLLDIDSAESVLPVWSGVEHQIVYWGTDHVAGEEMSSLRALDAATGEMRSIRPLAPIAGAPRISSDGRQALATAMVTPSGEIVDREELVPEFMTARSYQAVSVDLETGKTKTLTRSPLGALGGKLDPAGERLAYLNASGLLRIMDLESGEIETAWTSEAERIWVTAEALMHAGEKRLAASQFERVLAQFPELEILGDTARYYLSELYRDRDELDLAMKALRGIKDEVGLALKAQSLSGFLSDEFRLATDPEKDMVFAYPGDALVDPKLGITFDDVDEDGDLRELRARRVPGWLFLRLDYESDSGLAREFHDTIIMFDWDRNVGSDNPSPSLIPWDHVPEAQIVVRRWDESNRDLQIIDSEGDVRYAIKGKDIDFSKAEDSLVWIEEADKDMGGTVFWIGISNDLLKAPEHLDLNIQVCTRAVELERAPYSEETNPITVNFGPDFWVTDAFGEENSPERFKADRAAGVALEVRGYAGVLPSLN